MHPFYASLKKEIKMGGKVRKIGNEEFHPIVDLNLNKGKSEKPMKSG